MTNDVKWETDFMPVVTEQSQIEQWKRNQKEHAEKVAKRPPDSTDAFYGDLLED